MKVDRFIKAALLGLTLGIGVPVASSAETLRVMSGAPSGALKVPMNRAVVVESDVPFAELSIANPGIADISTLSDRTIYVLGKTPGRTTLTLLGADGKLITNVDVHVAPDIAEFKERLRQILPGEQIEVRTANDGIVLSGMVSSIQRLDRALDLAQRYAPERVSNLMVVGGTQQVMLKVRFAEMGRSVRKSLSSSLAFGNPFTDNTIGETGTFLTGGNSINGPYNTTPGTQGATKIGFNVGGLQMAVLLEALETKGVVRTLAEPNLTALSGQEASFLAGGEYPLPVSNGDNEIAVTYKPFGVELTFTPTVLADDVINLQLNAAVSGLDESISYNNGGFSINAFRRRETSTTVEMRDGESFAIAGLIEDDFQDNIGSVPWLGDIPVLGALFRSTEYQRSQSELVIIVTAHLVTPTRGEALAVPTDRIRPPSEQELFLFGNTTAKNRPKSGAAGEVAQQDFSGSYGYVMED
ncbi:type II and III secretion system protein family protein [Aliiroseovarius sp. Z3]|uniref:type II and III secretion system protein family protein n=1 Tax=Aliiroseovarius sp. Z3 TaxID=2811402 RepID=UPI0023B33054|nr:type II and III secretion system protein family protein [Aliiroseovarius sp. Z3]MDE9451880.1 type II and III secretion system protein family protein [Aliiroseovarius sp. Z3]